MPQLLFYIGLIGSIARYKDGDDKLKIGPIVNHIIKNIYAKKKKTKTYYALFKITELFH